MRCDSHVHIVGPPGRYPQLQTRTYLAGLAPLAELQRHAATRDVSRFVLVQPSFYGADNTLLLEGLDILGEQGRGVAVLDAEVITPRMLADYANRGVRGVRLNLYSTRAAREVRKLDQALTMMARARSRLACGSDCRDRCARRERRFTQSRAGADRHRSLWPLWKLPAAKCGS